MPSIKHGISQLTLTCLVMFTSALTNIFESKDPAWVLIAKTKVHWECVCLNVQPFFVKVMLKNKGCLRRHIIPMLLKKKKLECISYCARKNTEKKRRAIIYSLLARCGGAILSPMLCSLPSPLHPGTSQRSPVIYSTLHVCALSSRQCGKIFTGSPGMENDQLQLNVLCSGPEQPLRDAV